MAKGKVFVQTSKGVYPLSVLEKAADEATSSKQVKSVQKWMTENDLVPPPYPPNTFLALYESNAIFWRCVNQLATDVAGLGWSLQLKEGKKDNDKELEKLNALLMRPNPDDALRTILRQLLVDWGTIGWFGIEVVRNNKGEVAALYHVPAHTLRVHKSKEKFAQTRSNKKVWFKKFGLKKDILAKTGKEGGTVRTRANELIYYKNFYPKSDFYGVPNAISAVGDIMGLIGMRDYNLAFFENYGVPSAVVVLEGDWDENSDKKVSAFLNKEIKGTANAYKTLVVSQPDGCTFTYKPLGADRVKDASFKLYEMARREDVLIAYSMPPERVGIRITGKLGGNVAEEATRIYVQSVVEPLQLDLEDIINKKLLQSEFYTFKFADIDLRDHDAEIKQLGYEIERGMKTPNEARNELGTKPYPEGDKFFMMSSLVEVGEPDEGLSKAEEELLDDSE